MSDLEPVGNKDITSAGVRGVGATVGGIGLMVVSAIAGAAGGIVGVVLGGISLFLGLSGLKSHSKADRTGGAIALGAGALLGLTGLAKMHIPLISGIAGFSTALVGLGAVGLVGYGVWNLIKFGRGLKSRR